MKSALFAVCAAASVAGCALMGFRTIRYPSCGDFHMRSSDGANCQECLDGFGKKYGHCTSKVWMKR